MIYKEETIYIKKIRRYIKKELLIFIIKKKLYISGREKKYIVKINIKT